MRAYSSPAMLYAHRGVHHVHAVGRETFTFLVETNVTETL